MSSDPEMIYRCQVQHLAYTGLRIRNHVLWHLNFFRSTAGQRVKNTKLPAVQYFFLKIIKSKNSSQSKLSKINHHSNRFCRISPPFLLLYCLSHESRDVCDNVMQSKAWQVSQNMVSSSRTSINKVLDLRSYKIKSFQDCLSFPNQHTMVWISWNSLTSQFLQKTSDFWSFNVFNTLTGYCPYSHSTFILTRVSKAK